MVKINIKIEENSDILESAKEGVYMTWSDYYEKINDWAVSTAVNKISSLEDMGAPDEIVDALNIIAFENEKGATRLLNRALQHGVKFSGENLVEIAGLCSEESFKKALHQSAGALTTQDLEDMYGCVDDEIIIDVARRYKISAPADIADEYEEDLSFAIHSAIDAADYALECLSQAECAMHDSSNASFMDMITKGFFTSLWKYSSLSEADVEIQQAQDALQSLNFELRALKNNKSIQLKYGRLATAIDIWIEDDFFDVLTHLQINKAQKRIRRAMKKVENIRSELEELV